VQLLPISPKINRTFTLWNSSGEATSFSVEVDKELRLKLHQGMQMASRTKQERLTTSSTKKILSDLARRGITVGKQSPTYDEDDAVGLIGEILLTETAVWLGYEPVFVKWQLSGTSKSRGIDLVSRNREPSRDLILMEAKHLHSAVIGSERGTCSSQIKMRFVDGLDEFNHERVLINLASIIAAVSSAQRMQRATGGSGSDLDEVFDFLLSKLRTESYELEIHVLIDAKYCSDQTMSDSVNTIGIPTEVGNHHISLTLMQARHLESVSEEICGRYA
jgi:hypothetical protein